jgi:hypothetical protein
MARQLRVQYPGAPYHVMNRGEARFESAEEPALQLVAEALHRRGWTEAELQKRRKGDRHKMPMAGRLRGETTMTLKWTAERLAMGSWTNVSNLLAARRQAKP